jgi:hypothetical protein
MTIQVTTVVKVICDECGVASQTEYTYGAEPESIKQLKNLRALCPRCAKSGCSNMPENFDVLYVPKMRSRLGKTVNFTMDPLKAGEVVTMPVVEDVVFDGCVVLKQSVEYDSPHVTVTDVPLEVETLKTGGEVVSHQDSELTVGVCCECLETDELRQAPEILGHNDLACESCIEHIERDIKRNT